MIIKARHHWFFYWFFRKYSNWLPRLDFREIVLHTQIEDKGLPVLMIGNHFSWWDGFLAEYVNRRLFDRKYHVMMLEEQLRTRMFLNKTGAYSIRKGDRSMLETFRYSAELLGDPRNVVVMFPQGRIHSQHDHQIVFERGWYRMMDKVENPVQMVFFIMLTDYYSHRKPSLHIYVYDFHYAGRNLEEVEEAFRERFRESVEQQKQRA